MSAVNESGTMFRFRVPLGFNFVQTDVVDWEYEGGASVEFTYPVAKNLTIGGRLDAIGHGTSDDELNGLKLLLGPAFQLSTPLSETSDRPNKFAISITPGVDINIYRWLDDRRCEAEFETVVDAEFYIPLENKNFFTIGLEGRTSFSLSYFVGIVIGMTKDL